MSYITLASCRGFLETPDADLALLQEAAAALDALPTQPDAAMEQLASVCARCRVA